MLRLFIIAASVLFTCNFTCLNGADQYMTIRVIDAETQRGVPLVQLTTVNQRSFITDSQGMIAFNEPGLMNRQVFFHVFSHGYKFPKDGFGYRGRSILVKAGGTTTLQIQRVNIAERIYRVTGQGKYRDSRLLGVNIPVRTQLPGGVLGSDSVLTETIGDTIYWFWGDTNRADYPLGNFHVPGARSKVPGRGGLDPDIGVELDYFVNEKGFAKQTCKMPGKGPTWLDCLMKIESEDKPTRLFAVYVKVESPLRIYERGIVEFNFVSQIWQHRMTFPESQKVIPRGHSLKHRDQDGLFFYFAGGMPFTRVPATVKDVLNPIRYEAYTCLTESSDSIPDVQRHSNKLLAFRWTANAPVLDGSVAQKLVQTEKIRQNEVPALIDIETGNSILPHHGSVYYNQYRRRYIMIISQSLGRSMLGEIWYSEALSPVGPWKYARRVITHDNYSFYNPKQHPMFDTENGRTIFLEGTYTTTFSGNSNATPGYDYNQIMYKLDLTDLRLNLPAPVYYELRSSSGMLRQVFNLTATGESSFPLFYALNRAHSDARKLSLGNHSFWIAKKSGPHRLPLWKWTCANQSPIYLPQGTNGPVGHEKQTPAVGYVWQK